MPTPDNTEIDFKNLFAGDAKWCSYCSHRLFTLLTKRGFYEEIISLYDFVAFFEDGSFINMFFILYRYLYIILVSKQAMAMVLQFTPHKLFLDESQSHLHNISQFAPYRQAKGPHIGLLFADRCLMLQRGCRMKVQHGPRGSPSNL